MSACEIYERVYDDDLVLEVRCPNDATHRLTLSTGKNVRVCRDHAELASLAEGTLVKRMVSRD